MIRRVMIEDEVFRHRKHPFRVAQSNRDIAAALGLIDEMDGLEGTETMR